MAVRDNIRIAVLPGVSRGMDIAFEGAGKRVRGEESRKTVTGARKVMKALPLAPAIVRSKLSRKGHPFIVHHYLTMKCNCSCEQCLWKDNRAEQMTLNEIKKFHREAAGEGFVGALLGGGEPLLRQDAPEIFRHAKEKCGMKVAIGTNGYFIEDRLDDIGEYLDAMLISIDSADPEKHDANRGVKGLFDRVVRGVERIKRDYPFIHLIVNTCVHDGSTGEMPRIIELAEELDVPLSLDVMTLGKNVNGTGETDEKKHMIGSYDKISEALHTALDAKRRGAPVFNSEYYLSHFDGGKKPYSCRYPHIFLRVMANGDAEDCLRVGNPMGNVRTGPLRDLLESDRMERLKKEAEKCWLCSSPTMIDYSRYWDRPSELLFADSPLTGGRFLFGN